MLLIEGGPLCPVCANGMEMVFIKALAESPLFETPHRDIVHVFRCPVCHAGLVRSVPLMKDARKTG